MTKITFMRWLMFFGFIASMSQNIYTMEESEANQPPQKKQKITHYSQEEQPNQSEPEKHYLRPIDSLRAACRKLTMFPRHQKLIKDFLSMPDPIPTETVNDPVDIYKNTMLHEAAAYGTPELLESILALNPNLKTRNSLGEIPLIAAIKANEKNFKTLWSMYEMNNSHESIYNLIMKNHNSDTLFHLAINNTPLLETFLEMAQQPEYAKLKAFNISAVNSHGHDALHAAALANNPNALKLLLKYKQQRKEVFNINKRAKNNQESTPLALAISASSYECIKLLSDMDAKVYQTGEEEEEIDPLLYAIKENMDHPASIEILLERKESVDQELFIAIDEADDNNPRHHEVINMLCQKIENINKINSKRGTCFLHYAVFEGKPNICAILLNYKADINQLNRFGKTPLLGALQQIIHYKKIPDEFMRIITVFCRNQEIDVNLGFDDQNNTPLHLAAMTGTIDIIKALLDRGADITKTNNYGKTPAQCIKIDAPDYQEIVNLLSKS